MSLKIDINVSEIAAQMKHVQKELEEDLRLAVKELSLNTRFHIAELAQNGPRKLHTSAPIYLKALSQPKDVDGTGTIWVVGLEDEAMWIEEGIEPNHDMKPDILQGKSSQVVPFDQSKTPLQRTQKANDIMAELKAGLQVINKERKANGQEQIGLKKIEKNADGSPRIGRLHEFDIDSSKPTANAKHPALKGLTIYQSKDKNGKVRRDVLTFRTVSNNSDPESWRHPGYEARKYFDEAYTWAMQEWENNILPKVLDKWRS